MTPSSTSSHPTRSPYPGHFITTPACTARLRSPPDLTPSATRGTRPLQRPHPYPALHLQAHHQQRTTRRNAAKRPTLYPPPCIRHHLILCALSSPCIRRRTRTTLRSPPLHPLYPPGKPRNHPHPARSLVEVTALCNHCTLQSPLPHHLHPANSPSLQLPNKSASQ